CRPAADPDARALRGLHRARTRAVAPDRRGDRLLSAHPQTPRVAELAVRYRLPEPARRQLGQLLEILAQDPRTPSTIRNPERVLDDHLADSLVALELDPVLAAASVVDLGAGAGVPGLVLAIAK